MVSKMGHGLGKVRCPICRGVVDWDTSRWRPFCSERCRLIDLGHWVEESYRVPGESVDADEDSRTRGVPDDHDVEG